VERLGVGFSGGLAPGEIVECVRLAESLGYESAWIAEGHGGDQFALLAACAASTRRILLGTGISSVFVRSAPTIAMAAATVDHLSGGRLVLGLGSSHRVQVEPEHGVPFVQPTRRLRETVEVVRALVRDGAVSYAGEAVRIERFELWFAPLRREVPIYLAALFPPLLRLGGEIAEGVLLTWPTLDAARRAAEHAAAGAREAGRDPAAVDVASLLPCAVAGRRADALDRMRGPIAFYAGFFPRYHRVLAEAGFPAEIAAVKTAWDRGDRQQAERLVPDALVDAVALAGTPAECRERLARLRQAGIRLPIVTPRVAGPDAARTAMDAIRALAP
jgi:probable F420-dependent oxidoreductase